MARAGLSNRSGVMSCRGDGEINAYCVRVPLDNGLTEGSVGAGCAHVDQSRCGGRSSAMGLSGRPRVWREAEELDSRTPASAGNLGDAE
jgi:hypothetical protein